jgi:hypothetical protein
MLGVSKANIIDTKKVGRDMFVYWSGIGRVQVTKNYYDPESEKFLSFLSSRANRLDHSEEVEYSLPRAHASA